MAIDVLEKLKLQSELVDIFNRIETAEIIQKLSMQTRIIEIWDLLGVGDGSQPEEQEVAVSLVQRFLRGDFDSSSSSEFIDVLTDITPDVGTSLSLQQVIDQSNSWWAKAGSAEYQSRMGA